MVLAVMCAALSIGSAVGAIGVQKVASEPIGEGELFVDDARRALDLVGDAERAEIGVKRARNALEIEAVSVVDESGRVHASTSPNLEGMVIENGFLLFSIDQGRFAALATPVGTQILLDGVRAWGPEDVLYQVTYPAGDGNSILLHYDISELLSRRVRPAGIQSGTIQLLALTAVFAVLGTAIAVGHMRATRRYEAMAKESALLRKHAEELSAANVELELARHKAERALELAEEKIRIRSEFVLMINHELRTPLTSVITGARLLRENGLGPPEQKQLLDAMVADGTRLQEMIDQILAVARIENRGLVYELGETSIGQLREALVIAQADEVKASSDTEGVRVFTDVKALGMVVASLTANARTHGARSVSIAYGLSPLTRPMVEVGIRPEPAFYVAVIDDGPGIDAHFLPRVFEKFEKSSFSPGTGLGLYMARTMVEALDGSIGVETSPDGSSFEIALPAVKIAKQVVTR